MKVTDKVSKWIELAGSSKKVSPGSTIGAPRLPNEMMEVLVRIRRKSPLPFSIGANREHMSYAKYANKYGAAISDLNAVRRFAKTFQLKVKAAFLVERSIILKGRLADFSKAFLVDFKTHHFPDGTSYRGREGHIFIPKKLHGIIIGVFGLDERPVVHSHPRHRKSTKTHHFLRSRTFQTPGRVKSFLPKQLADIYKFPKGTDGHGQTIGIIEIGGGFRKSDLNIFFKISGIQLPNINVAKFRGGIGNIPSPKDNDLPNFEVLTDIQIVGSLAPKANIIMYLGKDGSTMQSILVTQAAIHDRTYKPNILSLSWGGKEFEPSNTAGHMELQYQDNMNDLFQTAKCLGITICASTGDNASACVPANDPNRPDDGRAHVEFPASSPFVLAIGGTHIINSTDKYVREEVWHSGVNVGTGGGISRFFSRPDYQRAVRQLALNPKGGAGRGIPDVSANAAGESGYRILIDGRWYCGQDKKHPPIGGTSCATPLWAALIARLNQALNTNLGFVNPLLYKLPLSNGGFQNVSKGNNGSYNARRGWNACTGLGTPNGQKLLSTLQTLIPRLSKKDF